jgi:hypothetical protein
VSSKLCSRDCPARSPPATDCCRAVPTASRIFEEIAALKALLLAFRGAGRGRDYRSLRAVLEPRTFDTRVNLRASDFIDTPFGPAFGMVDVWGEPTT